MSITRGYVKPWQLTESSREKFKLVNPRTSHFVNLGADHIREYMTEEEGCTVGNPKVRIVGAAFHDAERISPIQVFVILSGPKCFLSQHHDA